MRWAGRLAFGVIGIGGEAKADYSLVDLFGAGIKLRQAGEIAQDQGQYTGSRGIQCSQVTNRPLLKNPARAIDHIVRSQTSGLIDEDDSVHNSSLRSWTRSASHSPHAGNFVDSGGGKIMLPI